MTNGRAYSKRNLFDYSVSEEGGGVDETAVLITLQCRVELLELSWYSGVDFQPRKNAVIIKRKRPVLFG